ncbi:hypothetical protein CRUP_017143 [Coryphaenoides rupestris]|nr:hypothetical protein CRUP_017143 [Coryphaenoides rupestris]
MAKLQCHAGGGGHSLDLTYQWFHENTETPLASPSGPHHTIHSARLADAGQYWCQTKRGRDLSMLSHPVRLCITEVPVPRAELQTGWSEVFPSETVEMNCSIGAGPDRWTYTWYRGGQEVQRPADGLKLITSWADVFPTEKVELSCRVEGSSAWTYEWYRGGQKMEVGEDGSILSIVASTSGHAGRYTCRGRHRSRSVTTDNSDGLTLDVYEVPVPRAELQTGWSEVFPSETVEMNCSIGAGPDRWTYTWYRGGQEVQRPADGGTYWCTATRGHRNRPFTTRPSPVQKLSVSDIPKPSLKLITSWADVFPTEKVELSCRVEGSSAWTYEWYRGGQKMEVGEDGSILSIVASTSGHAGRYTCRGRHRSRSVTTDNSDRLTLNVYGESMVASGFY